MITFLFLQRCQSDTIMELKASKSNAPLGAVILAQLANKDIKVKWDKSATEMNIGEGVLLRTCSSIARYLAKTSSGLDKLYGGDDLELNTEIDHWLTFSLGPLANHTEFKNALNYLDGVLGPLTFLVGDSITIADYVVFGTLFASGFWQVTETEVVFLLQFSTIETCYFRGLCKPEKNFKTLCDGTSSSNHDPKSRLPSKHYRKILKTNQSNTRKRKSKPRTKLVNAPKVNMP